MLGPIRCPGRGVRDQALVAAGAADAELELPEPEELDDPESDPLAPDDPEPEPLERLSVR